MNLDTGEVIPPPATQLRLSSHEEVLNQISVNYGEE